MNVAEYQMNLSKNQYDSVALYIVYIQSTNLTQKLNRKAIEGCPEGGDHGHDNVEESR